MKIPKGFRTKEEYDFPNIINISVLRGQCPCECAHCPVGSTPKDKRTEKFGNGLMDLDTFKKIADEVSKFNHSVLRIHGVGEPLLWKNLKKALAYAKEKGAKTWLFTSLVTNDRDLIEFIANNCSIVEVSVNSIDKINYRNTKGIDNYGLVVENIKHFSEFIKKNNLKTRLIASRVESLDKQYDNKFAEYWKNSRLVADSFVRSYHNYNNSIKDREKKEKRKPVPCLVHWTRFNIDYNGDAVVCFNELFRGAEADKTLVLGNVNRTSIQEIWHGGRLSLVRKAQLKGDYSLVNFTKNLCCVECKYCQPLNTDRTTSEYQIKQLK
jgi:MoaA/NifB/PqqE/SkfB family radical SAM enzyme